MRGNLETIVGAMFAGKTSELLKRILWAKHQNKKIIVIKPSIDDRYSNKRIITHNDLSHECYAMIDWTTTLKKFTFNVESNDHLARTGIIRTHRGDIRTPAFMPVGTQATVKATFMDDIKETGSDVILGNTYHLLLRPGISVLNKFNGLHNFMNWNKPILTDSGGYQIMSLSKLNKTYPNAAVSLFCVSIKTNWEKS